MEQHNLDLITFAEDIRSKMLSHTPPLIQTRRSFFKSYGNTFLGNEGVAWAMKYLDLEDDSNNNQTDEAYERDSTNSTGNAAESKALTKQQAMMLFRRIMDAGLLRNVLTMEGFEDNKSLFRFSSDAADGDDLITSIAIGYRLYKRAKSPDGELFQQVCAYGRPLSSECMKASDIVDWMCSTAVTHTREGAVAKCRMMMSKKVFEPVLHQNVTAFHDDNKFYWFVVDYSNPPLSVHQFIHNIISYSMFDEYDNSPVSTTAIKTPPTYDSLLNEDGSMTVEALHHPNAPFVKKDLRVYPDRCGYGFCVRGVGPCYVKRCDSNSPAYKIGVREGQYVVSVNGWSCLDQSFNAVEDAILTGPKHLRITVMQAIDPHDEQHSCDSSSPHSPSSKSHKQSPSNRALSKKQAPIHGCKNVHTRVYSSGKHTYSANVR